MTEGMAPASPRWVRVCTVGLLCLVLFATTPESAALSLGVPGNAVAGTVIQGTSGYDVPEDLLVTLHTFSGTEETGTYTTTVDDEGTFRFDELSLVPGETAVVRAVHEGVTYVSDFVTVGEEEDDPILLPLTIYEITTAPTYVEIAQLHLFAARVGDRIQVREHVVLRNSGSRTYVGRDEGGVRATWSLSLPKQKQGLEFERAEVGERFILLEEGFADSRGIPPGETGVECTFSYELPLTARVDIEQAADIPISGVLVVLSNTDWELRADDAAEWDTIETEMSTVTSYATGPLQAHERLAFTILTGEAGQAGRERTSPFGDLVVGLIGVLAAALAVGTMWKRSAPGPAPSQVRGEIEALVALEEAHEQGALAPDVYREERRSLRRQVRRKMERVDGSRSLD